MRLLLKGRGKGRRWVGHLIELEKRKWNELKSPRSPKKSRVSFCCTSYV